MGRQVKLVLSDNRCYYEQLGATFGGGVLQRWCCLLGSLLACSVACLLGCGVIGGSLSFFIFRRFWHSVRQRFILWWSMDDGSRDKSVPSNHGFHFSHEFQWSVRTTYANHQSCGASQPQNP
jgi:hypothetical protein